MNRREDTVRKSANDFPGISNKRIMTDRKEDWKKNLETRDRFRLSSY